MTFAGNGDANQNACDGGAATAIYDGAIALDSTGNLSIVEGDTDQIRKVSLDGTIATISGTLNSGFDDGPALSATFSGPTGIVVDSSGKIFIGDSDNKAVRLITAAGNVFTVAGRGVFGFDGDGGPGMASRTGNLQTNTAVPSVSSEGIQAAAASNGQPLLARGTLLSIQGLNMAAAPTSAVQPPLGTDLAGTEVLFAGRALPLLYSSAGLVTAVAPYDLEADAQYPLLVTPGGAISDRAGHLE